MQANPHLAVFVKSVWNPKMLSWIAAFGIEQLPARLRMFPEIGGACDRSSLVPTEHFCQLAQADEGLIADFFLKPKRPDLINHARKSDVEKVENHS